jgi:hypothetical protein
MTQSQLHELVELLRARWPSYRILVRPFEPEDDPAIRHFVRILDVPAEFVPAVAWEAWTLVPDVFGEAEPPFVMTALGRETSAKFFPTTAEAG